MKQSAVNREAIVTVAQVLHEIDPSVVFVGGAVLGLYVNDPAAEDVRPTKDVDIVLQIMTEGKLESLRKKLTAKRFKQTAEDTVLCRFRYESVLIDVMSTHAVGWAPTNPWFSTGFSNAESIPVEQTQIRILPLSYFLATKFSAFHERGGNDPRTSHDIEDIVYILDNRMDLVEQIKRSQPDVREYLKKEFSTILQNITFQEAIRGHLSQETQTKRFAIIMERARIAAALP